MIYQTCAIYNTLRKIDVLALSLRKVFKIIIFFITGGKIWVNLSWI